MQKTKKLSTIVGSFFEVYNIPYFPVTGSLNNPIFGVLKVKTIKQIAKIISPITATV